MLDHILEADYAGGVGRGGKDEVALVVPTLGLLVKNHCLVQGVLNDILYVDSQIESTMAKCRLSIYNLQAEVPLSKQLVL